MLINLVPQFLASLEATDPVEAYRRYLDDHLPVLSAYWHNYILDLDSPHAEDVIRRAVSADRRDLHGLLDGFDVVGNPQAVRARNNLWVRRYRRGW